MTKSRRKLLPLLISALAAANAGAVGLGEIELHSHLGKPFEAVIPLNHLGDLDASQLKVKLGSEEEYRTLGVEFAYQHTLMRLDPVIRDGRGFIRVVTRDPVSEPYLNFVLNVRWPQGQLVREFAVLLDPPAQAEVVAARPLQITPVAVATVAAPESVNAPAAREREPVDTAPADGSYRVQPGDSLWKLAARWRPAGVGIEQMMGAIHAANPQAFITNDPSRLKAAASLSVPGAEQIAAAAPLGATSAPVQLAAEPAATGPEATATDTGGDIAPLPGPTTSVVRDEELVAENAALKSQIEELSSNVAALTGSLESSEARLREMENRIGALVDQLERQRVTTQQLATAAGVAPPRSESLVNEARAGELLQAPVAHTPWWVHTGYWAAIGALGAWLAFAKLRPRRREALVAAEDELAIQNEFEKGLVAERLPAGNRWDTPAEQENYWHHRDSVADLPLDLVKPEPKVVPPQPERPAFADVTVTRTAEDSVDPVISAGVFSAFGRYADAEQVLVEALQRDPQRVELKLQLLDSYRHQDKRAAFDALAQTIEAEHADDVAAQQELAALRQQYPD
jgi:pilus assembly protein FimV